MSVPAPTRAPSANRAERTTGESDVSKGALIARIRSDFFFSFFFYFPDGACISRGCRVYSRRRQKTEMRYINMLIERGALQEPAYPATGAGVRAAATRGQTTRFKSASEGRKEGGRKQAASSGTRAVTPPAGVSGCAVLFPGAFSSFSSSSLLRPLCAGSPFLGRPIPQSLPRALASSSSAGLFPVLPPSAFHGISGPPASQETRKWGKRGIEIRYLGGRGLVGREHPAEDEGARCGTPDIGKLVPSERLHHLVKLLGRLSFPRASSRQVSLSRSFSFLLLFKKKKT
jgi:hypothetical protein